MYETFNLSVLTIALIIGAYLYIKSICESFCEKWDSMEIDEHESVEMAQYMGNRLGYGKHK